MRFFKSLRCTTKFFPSSLKCLKVGIFEVPLPSYFCQTVRIVFQYNIWRNKRGAANLWLNYQFSSKNVNIILKVTILYQLWVRNTVSKLRWGYKLKNFPQAVPPVPKPIIAIYLFTVWNVSHLPGAWRLHFAWFFPYALSFSQSWINADIFYLYDKALTLKRSLILSNTNNKIWSKKLGPYVAKIFFVQSAHMKVSSYTVVWHKYI